MALRAAALAFLYFPGPVNLITDSACVAALLSQLEMAVHGHINHAKLFGNFDCSSGRDLETPFSILRYACYGHTSLRGSAIDGNAGADAPVSVALSVPVPEAHLQVVLAHQFYHQNWRFLYQQFGQKSLSQAAARSIVAACPACPKGIPVPSFGVNGRGLQAFQRWCYNRCNSLQCRWGIPSNLVFPIPLFPFPPGQAIVECMNDTLKRLLEKQRRGMRGMTQRHVQRKHAIF